MNKGKHYYTLLTKGVDGYWSPQFGDYDREIVRHEFQDYRDEGIAPKDLKIICTGPSQNEIMGHIALLNARS